MLQSRITKSNDANTESKYASNIIHEFSQSDFELDLSVLAWVWKIDFDELLWLESAAVEVVYGTSLKWFKLN